MEWLDKGRDKGSDIGSDINLHLIKSHLYELRIIPYTLTSKQEVIFT